MTKRMLLRSLAGLLSKYPSLEEDLGHLEYLLRDGRIPSLRYHEFAPSLVLRAHVHISGLSGKDSRDRCTLVYERDGDWSSTDQVALLPDTGRRGNSYGEV